MNGLRPVSNPETERGMVEFATNSEFTSTKVKAYKIRLRGSEKLLYVSNRTGSLLADKLLEGKLPNVVRINGTTFRSYLIEAVEPTRYNFKDLTKYEQLETLRENPTLFDELLGKLSTENRTKILELKRQLKAKPKEIA